MKLRKWILIKKQQNLKILEFIKVFCDASSSFSKNYRFYGDNLPDGTPCGLDRYCLDGECLVSFCL